MAASVCRVCLVGDVRRFYIEDDNMLLIYRKLTSTELNTVQRPRGVCYICLSLLQKCCRFSEMVNRSERILTDLLNQGIVVSDGMPISALDLGVQSMLSVASMQSLTIDGDNTVEDINLTIKDDLHVETESVFEKEHYTEGKVSSDFNQTMAITLNTTTNNSDLLSDNEPKDIKPKISTSEDTFIKFEVTIDEDFDKVITDNDSANDVPTIKIELKDETVENTASENEHLMHPLLGEWGRSELNDLDGTITEQHQSASPNIIVTKDHKGQRSNTCHICNKKFKEGFRLARHMRIHSERKLHTCNQCNKNFTCPNYLVKHMQIHSGVKPFACHLCNKSYAQKSYLTTHMRIHTNDRPYSCQYCDKSFSMSSNFASHMQTHSGEKPFACQNCNKRFALKSYLTIHMRIHTINKPFSCEHCDKSFTDYSKLIRHTRVHTGEALYTCQHCNRGFCHTSRLIRHMKMNPENKTFTCKHCQKNFTQKCIYLAHMKTYTEKKQNVMCNLCNKVYASKDSLRHHTTLAHAKDHPFKCKDCDKSFVKRCLFIRHVKTHNKKNNSRFSR